MARRHSRAVVVLALVLASLAAGAAVWLRPTPPQADTQPPLVLDPAFLELGDVWEDRDFKKSFTVENRSRHDVTIPYFAIDCNCKEVVPPMLTIPAGAKVVFTATFDLRIRATHVNGPGEKTDEFHPTIEPIISDSVGA